MKIPLDFFLNLVRKFLEDAGLEDISSLLDKHIDLEEDKDKNSIGNKLTLQELFKFYVKSHPEIKTYWEKKAKTLKEKYEFDDVMAKNGNKDKVKAKDAALLNKKTVRKVDSDEESSEEEVKPKKVVKKVVKKVESSDEESSEEEVKPKKAAAKNGQVKKVVKKQESEDESSEEEVKPLPKKNGNGQAKRVVQKQESEDELSEEEVKQKSTFKKPDNIAVVNQTQTQVDDFEKKPFQRIDNTYRTNLRPELQDNSYERFMTSTGDEYGRNANDKLKITKGRDFKKEKTKFKNKMGHGGMSISTEIRSIKLEDDSD